MPRRSLCAIRSHTRRKPLQPYEARQSMVAAAVAGSASVAVVGTTVSPIWRTEILLGDDGALPVLRVGDIRTVGIARIAWTDTGVVHSGAGAAANGSE